MIQIKDVVSELEILAPSKYQESYDNAGLIVGEFESEVTGILVSLDCTEEIIDEAIRRDCNMVVAHHPIVFKGLKSFTGKNYVERTIIKAIKNNIAIFAIHTNLDNVSLGVNNKIADKLGLINRQILMPKSDTFYKLSYYCPTEHKVTVNQALFDIGVGKIGNYDSCSFESKGTGSFKALDGANPYVGEKGKLHQEEELKIDVIVPSHLRSKAIATLNMAHPYEEVAYFLQPLANSNHEIGTGMIGELENSVDSNDFLKTLKSTMKTNCVRHTNIVKEKVKKVAVVGGSGSFALPSAIGNGADVFITADFKYHEFFDADGKIIIADIGHFESEQFTINLLVDHLKKKIPNFAILFTEINTNPINYL